MQRLFKIGYYIFIIALFAIGALLVATLFPITGNLQIKIVQSGSMEPTLSVGSLVFVKPSEQYFVDDIITFGEDTSEKVPTTHRIVRDEVIEGTLVYTTQGDANDDPDNKKVRQDEVIGKVLFSVPFAGYVLDFARQPIGFIFLVVVPATAIIVEELYSIFKEALTMRRKKKLEGEHVTHNEQ